MWTVFVPKGPVRRSMFHVTRPGKKYIKAQVDTGKVQGQELGLRMGLFARNRWVVKTSDTFVCYVGCVRLASGCLA